MDPVVILTAPTQCKAQNAVLYWKILIGELGVGNSTARRCIEKDNALQGPRDSEMACRLIISQGWTGWLLACREDPLSAGTRLGPYLYYRPPRRQTQYSFP